MSVSWIYMAEKGLRHRTFYEGDDDGSVLRALADAGLLPSDLEIMPRDQRKNPGKEGILKDMTPLVNPRGGAGRSAVAIRDTDDLQQADIEKWFVEGLKTELAASDPPATVTKAASSSGGVLFLKIEVAGSQHVGRVVGISAGLPGQVATEYGIAQFAIDDYILLLAREKAVFDSVSEFKKEGVSHDVALKKLREMVDIMAANGIPVKHTKRLMHLFRAITGYRAAPATFAERMVKQAVGVLGRDRVAELFSPLLAALREASALLVQ